VRRELGASKRWKNDAR
jgi:hypothetical protein